MKTEKRIVIKRKFDGSNNSNVITSKYMPSYKYALIALMKESKGRIPSVNISTFKTKSEAENYNPENGNCYFNTFKDAEKFYNQYINQ